MVLKKKKSNEKKKFYKLKTKYEDYMAKATKPTVNASRYHHECEKKHIHTEKKKKILFPYILPMIQINIYGKRITLDSCLTTNRLDLNQLSM